MEGWIKIHRKMLGWEWASYPNVVATFINILLMVNYEDKKWQGQIIKAGSFVTSYATLASQIGLSTQQLRTAIDKLKSTGEIVVRATNKYSIITVCKYDSYQHCESEEQQTNNKQITNEQQTNNNNIRNKEYKEIKNIRSKEYNNISEQDSSIKKFVFKTELINNGCSNQIADDYITVRNRKKAPSTKTAFDNILCEAKKVEHIMTFEDVIRTCIERNWIGFKAEWILKDTQINSKPQPANNQSQYLQGMNRQAAELMQYERDMENMRQQLNQR